MRNSDKQSETGGPNSLERRVPHKESRLLKFRQMDGQTWLMPDRRTTAKEPILITVAGTGVTIERFDHPDESKHADKTDADSAVKACLSRANPLNEYVVFLVRPTGIALFQDLVKSASEMGFEVDFDALGENSEIRFATFPLVGETTASPSAFAITPGPQALPSKGNIGARVETPPVAISVSPSKPLPAARRGAPPRKDGGWWHRFREWARLD
jgi:hypothetical protein